MLQPTLCLHRPDGEVSVPTKQAVFASCTGIVGRSARPLREIERQALLYGGHVPREKTSQCRVMFNLVMEPLGDASKSLDSTDSLVDACKRLVINMTLH